MKRRRTRRTRSPHPGVKLIRRERLEVETWYARFRDADSTKPHDENLTALGLRTAEARRAWAITRSKTLQKRAAELAGGAARHTGGALGTALADFLASVVNDKTRATYAEGVNRLGAWAASRGLESTDEVDPHHLAQFREALRLTPKRLPAEGVGRGRRKAGSEPAKASSVNNRLRSVKACLNWLRKQGRLPHVDAAAVKERLAAFKTDEDEPRFLRPDEVRRLMLAALRHDADTFDLTRDENAGRGERGTTPRNAPIAPFVVAALVGGFREGELRRLTWDMVDLDAHDDRGRVVGEVRLPAAATKTRRSRTVDLGVSPGLRRVLQALRFRSGGAGFVFPTTRDAVEAARRRLVSAYGAPSFSWQELRSTCETFHVNMPGLGSTGTWQAALRLGHSVKVAEDYYVGLVRGLPADSRALEVGMGIADLVLRVVARITGEERGRIKDDGEAATA